MTDNRSSGENLEPGHSYVVTYSKPDAEYAACKEIISTSRRNLVENGLSNIKATQSEEADGIRIGLENAGDKTIGRVNVTALYFDSDNKVIGQCKTSSTKIYGPGYKDEIEMKYVSDGQKYNSETGKYEMTYVVPARTELFLSGAYISTDN